jgi:hypothetical protein
VEISRQLAANFSPFNTLLLFAQFECNIIFFLTHTFKQNSLDGMTINFWAIAGDAAEANLFFFS